MRRKALTHGRAQAPLAGSTQDGDEHHRLDDARRPETRGPSQAVNTVTSTIQDRERHHSLPGAREMLRRLDPRRARQPLPAAARPFGKCAGGGDRPDQYRDDGRPRHPYPV
jgi:hypothetical protein